MSKAKANGLLSDYRTAGVKREESKQVRALLRSLDGLRKERDAMVALASTPVNLKALRRPMLGGKRQVAAVAVASDWHVEERVDPKRVQGLNRYTPAIAEFRARRFFESIHTLVNAYKRFDVRELLLVLNGDLITGWIHEELQATNYMSPVEAAAFVHSLLGNGIRFLQRECPNAKLSIVCETGNHGRTTLKRRSADPAATSYEWLVYHLLRGEFPELTWQVEQGLHSVVTVYGVRIHVTHGDTVKTGGGVQGILPALNRAATGWREKYRADMSIVGHFHQYTPTSNLVVNGSLIGYSSYADTLAQARAEPPQQAMFFIDAKRGVCMHTPLWVGDPSAEEKL